MPRNSPVHYIAPSAFGITPNCNGSANDLDVYLATGTKIKVYSKSAGLDTVNASFQEWKLKGRNRRLADSSKPYTIYARLPKSDKKGGYLVFAPKNDRSGTWCDKYAYVTLSGLASPDGAVTDPSNWYIRIGDVSLPEEGLRTITYDTGILDTDQYNSEWVQDPDDLPLRVEFTCTKTGGDAGQTPHLAWGESMLLTVRLRKGWGTTTEERFDHWEISRNTGDATADASWPDSARAAVFRTTGAITITHAHGASDDLNGAVSTTLTVRAMGTPEVPSPGQGLVAIATGSITVLSDGAGDYRMVFCDADGIPYTDVIPARAGQVSIPVYPYVAEGQEDISAQASKWEWHKYVNKTEDTAWGNQHKVRNVTITDNDLPTAWGRNNPVVFECVATFPGLDIEVHRTVGFG